MTLMNLLQSQNDSTPSWQASSVLVYLFRSSKWALIAMLKCDVFMTTVHNCWLLWQNRPISRSNILIFCFSFVFGCCFFCITLQKHSENKPWLTMQTISILLVSFLIKMAFVAQTICSWTDYETIGPWAWTCKYISRNDTPTRQRQQHQ